MATETWFTKLSTSMTSDEYIEVVKMNIFVALLCACIIIGHLLEENRWINESITALVIGVCTGGVIMLITNGKRLQILSFSEDLFFIYLLPPIIFNAGFQVKKKQFFRNFMNIILFGAVGTLISFCIISPGAALIFKKMNITGSLKLGDFLAIGAIFSATDSVCTLQVLNQDETPLLYSLVFGEGVVNDATSVVLFNAIQGFDVHHMNWSIGLDLLENFFYLFIASTALGVISGLLSAFIIKKLYFGRHSTDREVALMILMAYLSYVLAEVLALSSILTVFFCGIVMSHYTWHNVTESSRVTTKHTFATMSFVAETFIFLYVGMDALDKDKWKAVSSSIGTSIAVSSTIMGLVMIGRAAFVFPLSYLSNLTKTSEDVKIEFKQQVTIWWSGLMRGAVSMALAYNQFRKSAGKSAEKSADSKTTDVHDSALVITSTITVVLFSTFVFGLMTKPLIRILLPPSKNIIILNSPPVTPKSSIDTEPLLGNGSDSSASDSMLRPSSLRILLSIPTQGVHRYWRRFDDAVMRPIFGGRGFVPYAPGSPLEQSVHQWQ